MSLNGKTVFITGATSGFGLACARLCAGQGAKLIVAGRRQERLLALGQELSGFPLHLLPLDVRRNDDVKQAVQSLPKEFSQVDILINNAGLALGVNPYEKQEVGHLEQMVQTNIMGVMYCTHALLPGMIQRNNGHIVNIGSTAGNYPYPGGNVYGATKAFLKQFSLNLRADLLGKAIRVTNIEPGMAQTEFSLVRFGGDEAKSKNVYEGMHALQPDDVAEAILWCITRPAHVNVNRMEVMPTQQAFAPFAVSRNN